MGKVAVVGGKVGMEAPSTEIMASDIAVGSSVYLMENGSPVEYLVVNQGIPSNSSLYDSSCDGMWLLRKDIYTLQRWDSSSPYNNEYSSSEVNALLTGTFLASLGNKEAIKTARVPYRAGTSGTTINSGANGLLSKVFCLSAFEVGFDQTTSTYIAQDGAKLAYFINGTSDETALNRRIAYLGGTAENWWSRSSHTNLTGYAFAVSYDGSANGNSTNSNYGVRPAMILSKNALFDKDTLVLKGVK